MIFNTALTINFYHPFIINVPSSFVQGSESATDEGMNQILFVIGDWPVRINGALIGFGGLTLVLLLVIAIVIARSGRRGAELAMAQAMRADVLANKQSRGAFGQARMEAIVQDGMPKGSYEFQFTLSTGKRPDCVVFLPDQRPLCIDAKFPLEAMTALHDARSDEERKFASQRLRNDVLKHVSDIAEKYLIVGETQDTALMFVPSESVYAEIHDGFDDVIQKAYRARVVLVSPSLLMLAIQVMQQILKDARMRDAADQIRTEVLNLGDDLGRLRDRVLKLQKHFSDANEDVRQILISADKIEKRAGRIEELDFSKAEVPAEIPRIVKSGAPELFPLARKLQAGE